MSATPSVLLCLAHGNDAIEITTFLSLLPRAGIQVTVASVEGDSTLALQSAEGLTFQADLPFVRQSIMPTMSYCYSEEERVMRLTSRATW